MRIDRIGSRRIAGLMGGLFLAAAIGVTAAVSVSAEQGGAPTSKIAVVNIEKIINTLDELKSGQMKLQAKAEARQKELTELAKQIEDSQKRLDLLKTNDITRRDEAVKLMELNAMASAKQQAFQAIINIEKGDLFKEVHGHVMDACAKYAEKNGIELVLVDDRVLSFQENDDVQKVSALISQKRIMYAAPGLDITTSILQMMNNDFNVPGGKPDKPAKAK